MTQDTISIDALENAVAGGAVAIRAVTQLEPAGGPSDKIFPPTYTQDGHATTKYATEERLVGGSKIMTVLLDSVASQANRLEEALLEGWRRQELSFPVVEVDFTGIEGLEDLGAVTSLDAPHRIADAILRDSLLDGVPFRHTPIGTAFTESRPTHSTGMFQYCPTALVFGVWDSTGPKGGLGAKFQRCLVSEIVGMDAVLGVKTASRLDPLGIQKHAGTIYEPADPAEGWTLDESEARKKKGAAVKLKKGTPAEINHSNIPPSLDHEAGGVTISHAVQTSVLSLAGLRKLRFVQDSAGEQFSSADQRSAERAARTALAALALAAVVFQRENGFDLRSRSLLVAKEPLRFEILPSAGGDAQEANLDRQEAAELLAEAGRRAAAVGLGWHVEAVKLVPAPKLADLVLKSRELVQAGEGAEDEG